MEILYSKKDITPQLADQIAVLYKTNYGMYHYRKFDSQESVLNLLESVEFDCVVLHENNTICGFAGYYVNKRLNDTIYEIILAHLLVDKNYRGMNYGSLLENLRLQKIDSEYNNKIIVASCVEHPYASIAMKKSRGFAICGYRHHYRPLKNGRGNSIVMLRNGYPNRDLLIEEPNIFTKNLLQNINPNIRFTDKFLDMQPLCINVYEDKNLMRRVVNVCELTENNFKPSDYQLDEKFLKTIIDSNYYISIHVSPSISNFKYYDKLLCDNCFFPLCYIPCVHNWYGVIEYQYIRNYPSKLSSDTNISEDGKNFIKSIYNI